MNSRIYINPNFINEHCTHETAIRSVQYDNENVIVEVARMGDEYVYLKQYHYTATEIPETIVSKRYSLNSRHSPNV